MLLIVVIEQAKIEEMENEIEEEVTEKKEVETGQASSQIVKLEEDEMYDMNESGPWSGNTTQGFRNRSSVQVVTLHVILISDVIYSEVDSDSEVFEEKDKKMKDYGKAKRFRNCNFLCDQ